MKCFVTRLATNPMVTNRASKNLCSSEYYYTHKSANGHGGHFELLFVCSRVIFVMPKDLFRSESRMPISLPFSIFNFGRAVAGRNKPSTKAQGACAVSGWLTNGQILSQGHFKPFGL